MIKNKYALSWISITSAIQFLVLLLFIIFTITVLNFPKDNFGFSIYANDWLAKNWNSVANDSFQKLLANNGWIIFYQSFVIIAIASFVLFFLTGILSIMNFYKLKDLDALIYKKYLTYAIFGFVMFWKWYLINKKAKSSLKTQVFGDHDIPSINHKIFWNDLKNLKMPTNQTITTAFYYLLLLSSSFGFVIIWISYGFQFVVFEAKLVESSINNLNIGYFSTLNSLQRDFISLSPFTSTLTFYTQLTNFACLIYAWIVLFKPKANIFRNNTLSIQIATYIIIVAVVYWSVLFEPNVFTTNSSTINAALIPNFISTCVTHGITPFSFLLYTLILINYNKAQPVKYWKSFDLFLIYPLSYGVFLYLVPVFSIISIYGIFSNINPNNTISVPNRVDGNPIWLLGIIVLVIAFAFFYFTIWIYAALITRKPLLKQKNLKL